MDKETQKKVLIGGLAVLILGAGSYFFWPASNGSNSAASAAPAAAPRVREVKKDTSVKVKTREKARAPAEVAEVRERAEPTERARGPVRERRDNTRKIEKKKEVKPAA